MSMDYIRKAYGVPAKRGMRVEYTGESDPVFGTIVGSDGHYLRIKIDGWTYIGSFHPTDRIIYPTDKTT